MNSAHSRFPSDFEGATAGRLVVAYLLDLLICMLIVSAVVFFYPSWTLAAMTIVELCLLYTLTLAIYGHTIGSVISRTRGVHARTQGKPGITAASLYMLMMTALHLGVIAPLIVQLTARNGQTFITRLAGIIHVQKAQHTTQSAVTSDAYGRQTASGASSQHWDGPASDQQPISPHAAHQPLHSTPNTPQTPTATSQRVASTHGVAPTPVQRLSVTVGNTQTPTTPNAFRPAHPTQPTPASQFAAANGAASPASQAQAWVIFDSGERAPIMNVLIIGREPQPLAPGDQTLLIADPSRSMSRNHVRLSISSMGLQIEDLRSANGTTVKYPNGAISPLAAGMPARLLPDCQVRCGDRLFRIAAVRN